MKKIISFVSVLLLAINSFADNGKEQWPALQSMHHILSETSQHLKKGEIKFVEMQSRELIMKAHDLKKSTIPEAYNSPEVIHTIAMIEREARELEMLVNKKASKDAITKQFNIINDDYTKIVKFGEKRMKSNDVK